MYFSVSFGLAFIKRDWSMSFFLEETDEGVLFCLQELKTSSSMSICSIFAFFIEIIFVIVVEQIYRINFCT
jgi:hypothetical protein